MDGPEENRPTPGLRLDATVPGVLDIVLDAPRRHNALTEPLVSGLRSAVAGTDRRVIVLRSAQSGTFCAGVHLGIADDERRRVSDGLYALYEELRATPAIVIAVIDGPAIGGGAQLALASDIRIAGPAARLRFLGVGHGLAVGAWGLPALVGRGRALELCLSMREVQAPEAFAMGLVDRLEDDPQAAAAALVASIVASDAGAVARAKAVVREAAGGEGALALERRANATAWDGSVLALTGERGGPTSA